MPIPSACDRRAPLLARERVSAWWLAILLALVTVQPRAVGAEAAEDQMGALLALSLENLGNVKVTTVSRKSEALSSAAAAVDVITQEDIRRSGANILPEVLRMSPGLAVARANSRQWAISSRGFNDTFANKLLVLVDGRTVYTPLFSGVFWEETDTVLEDIDRIEVIRGPGATLWGANAVNGVINIITKSAKETQGLLISGGGGMEEQGFGTVRYGTKLADNLYLRAYGKYANHEEFTLLGGGKAKDYWWLSQGGFRLDWESSAANTLTFQGDYRYGTLGGQANRHTFSPPALVASPIYAPAQGGNILARWTHRFSADSEMSWQAYYDRTDRDFRIGQEIRDTVDVDAQHRFQVGERQEIVWGGGYRFSADNINGSPDFVMHDPSESVQWVNLFVQDQIALVPDRWRLTVGTKLEHNNFTGFEFQPSARLAWTPHERHTFWGAISRAVRTPSRTERDLTSFAESVPAPPPGMLIEFDGNPDMVSEELLAYEIGYRVQPHSRLTLDWSAFYNDYENLRAAVPASLESQTTPVPYLLLHYGIRNSLFGESFGAELSATWQPCDFWRLRANYALFEMQLHSSGVTPSEELLEKGSPHHQIALRSDVDLGRHVEWGLGARYVDRLAYFGVPDYTELEMRLAWKPTKHCEIAVVGRDLLHAHHQEFNPVIVAVRDVQVDRAIYAKVTLRF